MIQSILDTLKTRSVIPEAYAQRILAAQDIHTLDDAGRSIIDYIVAGAWVNPADTTQDASFLTTLKKMMEDAGVNTDANAILDFAALVKNRDPDFISNLWQSGWININKPDNNGNLLLESAVQSQSIYLVNQLLKAPGLLINAQNKTGMTALMIAAQRANATLIESLLKQDNIDIDLVDKEGHSVFYHAKANPKVLDLLYRYRSEQAHKAGAAPLLDTPMTADEVSELTKKLHAMVLHNKRTLVLGAANRAVDLIKTSSWSDQSLTTTRYKGDYKKDNTGKWNYDFGLKYNKKQAVSPHFKVDPLATLPLFQNAPLLHDLMIKSITIQHTRGGNCDENSSLATAQLWRHAGKNIKRIERVHANDFDHAWAIINRKPGTSLLHPKEWGEDCWIFDTWWENETPGYVASPYYPASQFHENMLKTLEFGIANEEWLGQHSNKPFDNKEQKVYERYLEALQNGTLEIPLTAVIDIDTQIFPYPDLKENEAKMALEDYYQLFPYLLKEGEDANTLLAQELNAHKALFEKSVSNLAYFTQKSSVLEKRIGDNLMIDILEKNHIITPDFAQELLHADHLNSLVDSNGKNLLHFVTLKKWHAIEMYSVLSLLLKRAYFNVNQEDNYGKTVLHNAILTKNKEAIQILIEHPSMHLNNIDNYGMTYLDHASDDIDIFKLLLQNKKINLNTTDKFGYTILHHLIDKGNMQFLRVVLQDPDIAQRFNTKATDKKGRDIWQYAAESGNTAIIALLHNTFALEYCIKTQNIEKIKQYLNAHPAVKLNNKIDFTEFAELDPTFLEYLYLNNHLDHNTKDSNNLSLLEVAVEYNLDSLLDHLFKQKDLDINIKDRRPLNMAINQNNSYAMHLLLQNDTIDISHAVIYALMGKDMDIIRQLLRANNNDLSGHMSIAKLSSLEKITPLMMATLTNYTDSIPLLLTASKVNINAQSGDGTTALHSAVKNGNITIVNALLQCAEEIDLDIQDNEGHSIVHYAQGKPEILKLLQAYQQRKVATSVLADAHNRPKPVVTSYHTNNPSENINASMTTTPKTKSKSKSTLKK